MFRWNSGWLSDQKPLEQNFDVYQVDWKFDFDVYQAKALSALHRMETVMAVPPAPLQAQRRVDATYKTSVTPQN